MCKYKIFFLILSCIVIIGIATYKEGTFETSISPIKEIQKEKNVDNLIFLGRMMYKQETVEALSLSDNKYQVKYSWDEGYKTQEVTIQFVQEMELQEGILYSINVEEIIPIERFPIYLYVQKDRIYRVWESDFEKIKSMDEKSLIVSSMVVWQEKKLRDGLKGFEKGEHHYIIVENGITESHFYQCNDFENITGFWEEFYWENEKGMIKYRSGFRMGAELVELTLIK